MLRRMIAALMALMMLTLCCAEALAVSSLPADFLAQTDSGAYFKLDNMLIRIDGDAAEKVAEGSISSVAAIGDTAYCLQYGEDFALDIVQYAPGSDPVVLYEFAGTDRVSHLTAHGAELFVLVNDLLHVVYPSNGMCIKLANTEMSEYVWLNDTVYFVALKETVEHAKDSLLGGEPVKKSGGVLYSLDLNTGSMVQLLTTGIEDLRAGGDLLYFHDLSDAYVMGSAEEEWLEGRVYSMDPVDKQKTCVVNGYDWGFYPMADGVAVYTADGVSLANDDGTMTALVKPQGAIHAVSTDDALFVFDLTANVLYRYDGQMSVVASDALGGLLAEAGRTVQSVEVISVETPAPTEEATVEPTEDATAEPTAETTAEPTVAATAETTATPAAEATTEPTKVATAEPTLEPTATPTATPTVAPTATPTAAPTATPAPTANTTMDSSYIFPNSDTQKLTKAEIEAVDKSLWSYGRNEIFARHGYYFGDDSKYQEYFESKSWYWAGGFSTSDLNSVEWYNMQLLKEMEGLTSSSSSSSSGSSSSGSSSSSSGSSGYIFANSSTKKLTRKQILSIDKSMWGYARNEIYARHGYSFKTAKYRNYFRKKSWYKEGGFSTGDLNSIEWYNMDLIKSMEEEYGVD